MKKAIKDLQPGDILPATAPGEPVRVVLMIAPVEGVEYVFHTVALGLRMDQPWSFDTQPQAIKARPDTLVDVEPRVSAYELESLILIARNWIKGEPPTITARNAAQEIVNKLSPPNPPTYEELLDAVRDLTGSSAPGSTDHPKSLSRGLDLINRARNAGVLK
jgi:hypothetical protein